MKTKPIKVALGTASVCAALAIALVSSCKKDKVELLTSTSTTGTDAIDATIGGGTPDVPLASPWPGKWKMDKAHSNVMWETKYYATGAPLTGRFNMFDMKVKFDQANPANTTINAWVKLSTFNTGESGRDGLWRDATYKIADYIVKGGCGLAYMGVVLDTLSVDTAGVVQWKPRATTDTATFQSTSCVKYGNGYMVTGNFTFRGVTKSIQMPMTYTAISTTTNTTTGQKTDRAGLIGKFDINALTVFGVKSSAGVAPTSIADIVTIRVDCNFVSNPY